MVPKSSAGLAGADSKPAFTLGTRALIQYKDDILPV